MHSAFKRWLFSLRGQLLVCYIVAWLIAALLFGLMGNWALRSDGHLLDHGIERILEELPRHLQYDAAGQPHMQTLPSKIQWLFSSAPLDVGYRIFDARGNTLLWSSDAVREHWQRTALLQQTGETPTTLVIDGVLIHTATQALRTPSGDTLWLQIALSERLVALRHDELDSTFGWTIVLATLLSISLLGLVLWRVLLRVMAPVQRISREAQAIEPRGPWQRLGMQDLPSEIVPLVSSFNQALNRLEEGFERQQRFLADAAHELKTPLALLRANIEMGETDRTVLMQDIDHLSRQVQQLLMLAEVSEPRSYQHESIEIAAVIDDVLKFLAPLANKNQISLQRIMQTPTPSPTRQGDRSALFVLLKNLVENAIHVSPPGALIAVCMYADQIDVCDQGPGIAPEYLPRLFERFWRVPGSREGGAGLGLSICQEVAMAHGWQLQARNVHRGATFSLLFQPTGK